MKRLVLALIVVGLSTISVLAVPRLDTRPACQRASEWVWAHQDNLPTSLDEIAALPVVYRVRIFSAASPETKANLWREQMQRALSRPDLNEKQVAFIRDNIRWITPDLYSQHRRLPQVETVARALFVAPPHQELMITLGSVVTQRYHWRTSSFVSLTEGLLHGPAAPRWDCGTCSCNFDEGCWNHCFITWGLSCENPNGGGGYCTVTEDGCGFWGGCVCDGCCCSGDGGSCISELDR